jgi:septal ring factor EnvC (AmiA/AmiB activator)
MAVSTETRLAKSKQRVVALLGQIKTHRAEKARLIAKVRDVVAGRGTLERQLAGTHGVVTKLEQQLIKAGLTPVTHLTFP